MDFKIIDQYFVADFNIDSVFSVRQSWERGGQIYNRIQPRTRNGLLLFTNYPAEYILSDGSTLRVGVGDVVLLPKGSCYTTKFTTPDGKASHPILINFRMTDLEGNEICLGEKVCRIPHREHELFPLFDAAAEYYKKSSLMQLKATVYKILSKLFPIKQEDECCISYIGNHYTAQFQIGELARKCSLSETAYRKKFKELTGESPLGYINRLKIEKACEMLLNSDIKPADISDFLNFYSPQYFYRVFKQYMGITPKEYREKEKTTDG